MDSGRDDISQFYLSHLGGQWSEKLVVECPFCRSRGVAPGKLVVFLNRESFFYGYFRCLNRCVAGGFALWFAQLAAIPLAEVPGYDHTRWENRIYLKYAGDNINEEIQSYQNRSSGAIDDYFGQRSISTAARRELQVGYNGRYLVYPYIQEDGNCYSARCVHPENSSDFFWHGNEKFTRPPYCLFNVQDIARCENGALFLCEKEESLLALKQLGFPGVAVADHNLFEELNPELFAYIKTLFIFVANSPESIKSARKFASRVGYKARIVSWPPQAPNNYTLVKLAADSGENFSGEVGAMIRKASSFSPFRPPAQEFRLFRQGIARQGEESYRKMASGFSLLDRAIGGIHGINVIGGGPKVGKSTFVIQIASEMSRCKIPVLYYDFENGRQKIYQRTLSRLARMDLAEMIAGGCEPGGADEFAKACGVLEKMLFYWRIVNDRKITPELMKKHIEFIRHETRSDYTVVVIDSLHKLPFKEFAEKRVGIDAWLRQMESIRDDLQVSFLVISELSRGEGGAYDDLPHLGVFKGSGDIEYSADNAMVLFPEPEGTGSTPGDRGNRLHLVASREHSPGIVADYRLDFPYWSFVEKRAE
ncbi:DnaB-like helicase C-terminal domain-containing protein [Desulforhopalus singaporensis]|nr:DnaB-like helicase C-terminal domain-containing protein [Desulforhopalus singaporensis]